MSTPHPKRARTDHPVLDVIASRFSPYLFSPRPVETEKLLSCLEAARWAASSYNEQPWTFLVAPRTVSGDFALLLDCLLEANRQWCASAGVLVVTAVCKHFARNGKENRVAEHDVGLASANFCLQAVSLGLAAHMMAGFDPAKAQSLLGIPPSHTPLTMIALGYAADPALAVDSPLAQRDLAPRERKLLSEMAFAARWKTPLR